MKQLETQFVSAEGGFGANPLTYNQLTRNDNYAIYERSRDGKVKDYEVIRIRILKAGTRVFQNIVEEDMEQYAVSSSWGRCGWSFGNLTAAENKYNALSNPEITTEEVEGYDVDAPTDASVSGGKRGRVAKVRSPITYPSTPTWSVKDILTINLDYDQPTISLFLKKQIGDNKVALVGHVEKADGQRGKAANLYSLV